MSTPTVAFFNNKGGVGKTSLVYHLAWMMADQGMRVVAADLDPQGNLTSACLTDDQLEELWLAEASHSTIYGAVSPLARGVGDISAPVLQLAGDEEVPRQTALFRGRMALIPGDMALSGFEDQLSEVWPKCGDGDERAFRVTSAFWRILQKGAEEHQADLILIDLGPNLGAINRAALIASDYIVIPLGPDLFSLQGLQNLGPKLCEWRAGWRERVKKNPDPELELPSGRMTPIGYIVMQHSVRMDRPVKSYDKWINRIPAMYRSAVLATDSENFSTRDDPHCLGLVKHFRSLMPMAQEVRKPMFYLKPADGALGAHLSAVKESYETFSTLSRKIVERTGVPVNKTNNY